MARIVFLCLAAIGLASAALAQTPASFGDSAKAMIGAWEFSNADRDKICTVTFKNDPSPVGFKLEFNQDCPTLFPLVSDVAGWSFPDNDLLHLVDAKGKVLIEFSEVEDGIYEAPTPGIGVLFLQNSNNAGPPPKPPEQVAGDWTLMRAGKPLCQINLATTAAQDGLALTLQPSCDPAIARVNFTLWKIDRDELMLVTARGAWRFEEVDANSWRRVPEGASPYSLVRR